ncbi:hypothetical protein K469DRAFT_746509 [Zopfia rhizophila CBS 207.26]|uniref:F-box domain-containing protein n=1 Tax=Zopfia rhizophila CBS 207.26 TaxID=1314779 RepID=A0A6A6EG86_9PEZI|nr:hypothetical protein K469DRAFT_746509 [Zopfia rhizophila CBS 207.26]
MLRLLSPQRDTLLAVDSTGVHEAPRPCTASQIESRNSISLVASSRYTSHSTDSALSRRSSVTTYSSQSSGNNLEVPHLTKTPWELERHKRSSRWHRSKPAEYVFPAHVFKTLPREVYDCIVEQLEYLYLGQNQSCPSCYMKDLCNLALTSRAWDRAATAQLYRKVWVLTNEDHPKMPKLKIKETGRLKLLRRTLRERQALARCVRELHMSDIQSLYQNAGIEKEEIVNLVASVVIACPNLERVVGFHIPYTHTFDRLSHALSTRRYLKERIWLLSEDTDLESDEEEEDDPSNIYYHAATDPTERFLDLNSNHPSLTTLVLHQHSSHSSVQLTFRALIGTFRQYPSLRHLSISNLPSTSFTNLALNSLPPNLESLRLENLRGVNDKGLQRFATSHLSTSLKSLTLINLEISNLVTISNFLSSHLGCLKRFSLSQHKTPTLPSDAPIPTFHSITLTYIHWEIRSQAGPPPALFPPFPCHNSTLTFPFSNSEPISCLATSLLSTSIKSSLFPSLFKIRAPHDPQGLLQALCRPKATALLPSDAALLTSPPRPSTSPSNTDPLSSFMFPEPSGAVPLRSHRIDSACYVPPSPKSSLDTPIITATTPAQSRLAAQSRILAARKVPFMVIKVTNPKGIDLVTKTIYGFLGTLDSKIEYEMRPDRNRVRGEEDGEGEERRESDWITGIGDVVGEWEVVGSGRMEGCGHFGGRGGGVGVRQMF